MREIQVFSVHFTEKNRFEDLMTDDFIKLFQKYGASPVGQHPPGTLMSLVFRERKKAKAFRSEAKKRGYSVTSVGEAYIDECHLDKLEHNESKMPQPAAEMSDEEFEIMGLKAIISELQGANSRLKEENGVLEGVVRNLKTKHTAELLERDARLHKLTKECLALEHRMKEMEDAWKGWKE